MKLKLSILTILLFFLSASFPLAAQKAPQPFDIDTPSLRVFLPAPELATGRAIVACPGGGYGGLAVNHEGYDWAPYFNKQGIALIVLKYRMPHGDRTLPISDAEAAMKMARDSADVWNLNPYDIGIMGSSAGGHLASTIATHARPELRPNFQILFYPVITMDKSYTHIGSHDNLLGKDASAELETEFSNEKQVTKETPCAFIAYMTCTADGFSAWGKDMGGYSSNPTVAAGTEEKYHHQEGGYVDGVNTFDCKNDRGYEWWADKLVLEDPEYCASVAFTVGSWIEVLDKYSAG